MDPVTGRVAGKVALVTGAARGMGRSHAVILAEQGADIIAVDWCTEFAGMGYPAASESDLEQTAELVQATGRRVASFTADVRDRAALGQAIESGVDALGGLDIVVANAAVVMIAPWDAWTSEQWELVMGVNLTGTWNTAQLASPYLVRGGGGSIILISSANALKAIPFSLPYVTAKHGVVGVMHALAIELAEYNIRVNTVHPTGVDTPMNEGTTFDTISELVAAHERIRPSLSNLLPVDMLEPKDVSQVVLYLASDESRYVTSSRIPVDAGMSQF